MEISFEHKEPQDCTNIEEVRREIDLIDRMVVAMLSKRFSYVREVVKYKDGTAEGIEANKRRELVLRSRRKWAKSEGLDPDVIEDIYARLIDYFIDEEKKLANINPES